MSKKMTKQDFHNYIISEAKKLYKIEVLKERRENIKQGIGELYGKPYKGHGTLNSIADILAEYGEEYLFNTTLKLLKKFNIVDTSYNENGSFYIDIEMDGPYSIGLESPYGSFYITKKGSQILYTESYTEFLSFLSKFHKDITEANQYDDEFDDLEANHINDEDPYPYSSHNLTLAQRRKEEDEEMWKRDRDYEKNNENKQPMKNKMNIQEFQNYIISEATKLYKIEVLKEEKERIIGQLKVLNEIDSMSNYEGNRGDDYKNDVSDNGVDDLDLNLEKNGLFFSPGELTRKETQGGAYSPRIGDEKTGHIYSYNSDNSYPFLIRKGMYRLPGGRTGVLGFHELDELIKQILFWEKNEDERKDYYDLTAIKYKQFYDRPLDENEGNGDGWTTAIMNEDSNNLRGMLHTLVGNARRLEKRADMSGGVSHHVDAYLKAEQELAIFLKQNPSMMEFLDDVEDHFMNQLYK